MVSFGHSAFYGIGAYTLGILLQKTSLSIPASLGIVIIFSATAALIIGFFCTRLAAIYFAMLTLAFSQVVYAIVTKLTSLTGGYQGLIGGIPKPKINLGFASWDIGQFSNLYTFTVIVVVISLLLIKIIIDSHFGCILKAIRENPQRTSYVGINQRRYQLIAFILAGVFGGIAGALMAFYVSGAYPDFIFWTTSAEPIFMILIGGLNTFLGPVIGALILFLLTTNLKARAELWGLVLGSILICFTIILKKGLTEFLVGTNLSRWLIQLSRSPFKKGQDLG
jgi:branched-chain amino acid transport system permease protein